MNIYRVHIVSYTVMNTKVKTKFDAIKTKYLAGSTYFWINLAGQRPTYVYGRAETYLASAYVPDI